MDLVYQIQNLQLLIFSMDGQQDLAISFLYCFIILLHLMSSFLHARSLLVPCANVFIQSIDYILLSSFEFKAILLISSVKPLYFLFLNLCYVFNMILICLNMTLICYIFIVFINSLRLSVSIYFF